jgi:hypothetical protein
MPTPAEQKALAFLAIVTLLGGAVRVVRGGVPAGPPVTAPEQQALARQAVAANSVATAARQRSSSGRKPGRRTQKRRYTGAKFDSTGVLIEGTGISSSSLSPSGFPQPGPRIDVGVAPATAVRDGSAGASKALVDLDLADTLQIGRLPRVGPALARRIVANRDSLGPFGALPALRRVKGVGPATLERLAGLVTFSGQTRR